MKKILPFIAMSGALTAQQPMPSAADYNAAAQILQGNTKPATRKPHTKAKPPTIEGTIEPIHVQRELPLPMNAQYGLKLSEAWLTSGPLPTSGTDGRVLYTYGQGVPTVICAILQVCELDLEPGETPNKDALDWGDHRFEVVSRTVGAGERQYTYLVLKPTEPGLDTTMTVGTNKRAYYVRLISTSSEHMARVAFLYPEEEAEKKAAAEAAKKAEDDRQKAEADRLAKLNTATQIRNWNYDVRLHGKDAKYLQPKSVSDDGVHTYIVLTEEARHRGLPVVQISDARGPIPANAHWDQNTLIVDSLFDRACLLEGVGRKQQRACITNQGLQSGGDGGH